MIEFLLSAIFRLAARLIVSVLIWLALFPVAVVLATPFILLFALFDRSRYTTAVRGRYAGFYRWWMNSLTMAPAD